MAKYDEWLSDGGLRRIEGWARDGLVDEQIAKRMGISRTTLARWRKNFPVIQEAMRNGKDAVDRGVENSLLRRALGYTYVEEYKERRVVRDENDEPILKDGQLQYELVVTKTIKKEVPPDVTAQQFWLKNRKSLEWHDRRETHVTGFLETKEGEKLDSILNQLSGDKPKDKKRLS